MEWNTNNENWADQNREVGDVISIVTEVKDKTMLMIRSFQKEMQLSLTP